MAGDSEHDQPTGIQARRTAEESVRPAWAKPVIRRFSLAKTLTGNGNYQDGATIDASVPS